VVKKRSLKPQPVVLHKIYRLQKKSIICKATLLNRWTKRTSYNSSLTEKSEVAIKKNDAGQNFSASDELRNRRTRRHQARIPRANIVELTFVSMAKSLQYLLFWRFCFNFWPKPVIIEYRNPFRQVFILAGVLKLLA